MASQRTSRSRFITAPSLPIRRNRVEAIGYPVQIVDEASPVVRPGTQTTVSEGHPFRSRNKQGLTGDLGGPFFTTKTYVEYDGTERALVGRGPYGNDLKALYSYKGPILARTPPGPNDASAWPSANYRTDVQLEALGAKAVARCKPTNSPADLGTALGEIFKDGLPSLVGSRSYKDRALQSKQAGDEYLNVQFGWLPLVSDIRKTAETMRRARAVIEQYERDAGRVVRRRYEFPIEHNVTESLVGTGGQFGPHNVWRVGGSQGKVTKVDETWVRTWFSGAFTYHLPSGYDSRKKMDRGSLFAEKILGLDLTPDLLWNLAPWSWAADWFTNTGDVISNITDLGTDGLVMRYGYMMEHSIHRVTYTSEPFSVCYQKAFPSDLSFVTETKKRVAANPYGFGVTWSGLSPKQVSILSALGLSRRG